MFISQTPPSIAIVLEGGLVQSVIVEDWPLPISLPRVVVVDYDIGDADEDDLTSFFIGDTPVQALCHSQAPDVYETFKVALSPHAVLAARGESVDSDVRY